MIERSHIMDVVTTIGAGLYWSPREGGVIVLLSH